MARSQQPQGAGARKRRLNYPRAGYGPIRRWIPSWRAVLAGLLGFIGICFGAVVTVYLTLDVPKPGDFATASITTVYYSDGTTKMGTFADYQREIVTLDNISEDVQHGVVASEDSSFYTNSGISIRGIGRAFVNNIRGGAQQGGSTLTQQYVERYYLGTTTGYVGKAKEALLAIKINREQSKDEVMANYLNTIYFGRGAYGIEMAAQKYFGVSANDVTLSQAALLVAVIPAPSSWDPAVNETKAKERWNRVLNRMQDQGYITAEQRAAQTFPTTIASTTSNDFAGTNGYLLSTVESELINSGKFTQDDINQNGLKIVTTIDKDKQADAVAAVDALPSDRPANNYVGLVSVDPRNGEIYALYGGADYLKRQRNSVTQDQAQAGSTFKPFALLAALEQGTSLYSTYSSSTPKNFGDIEVENFDGISRGMVNLITATKYSINTAYVGLNQQIGPENTKAAAIQAGLPADTTGLDDSLTNVLGSASPRLIDMAKAYTTFANEGKTTTPHIVRSITDRSGTTIYEGDTSGNQAVSADIVATMNTALEATTTSGGTAQKAAALGRPVAAKTGTSTGPSSAWFIGYTPQMLTAVNMYQIGEDGSEEVLTGFGGVYAIGGGSHPGTVWTTYMKAAMEGMDVEEIPTSTGKSAVTGGSGSGGTSVVPQQTQVATPSEQPSQEATTSAPATQEPTTTASPTQAPTVAPTTQAPTVAPTTQAPVTQAPTVAPTTQAPATQAPTVAPTTQEPAAPAVSP